MVSKSQKILLIIGVVLITAFVLSIVVTYVLEYEESTQIESLTSTTTITISNETMFGSPFKASIKKGSFDSVGEVYVYMYSPYANDWNTFNVWMSLDNSSWVIVPFLESTTNNRTQMADLGLINYGNPQLTTYVKYYVPPQAIFLPPNVTKQDASNFDIHVIVQREATPADTTQWISVFFMVFGAIGTVIVVLGLYFSLKDSNSNTQNVGKKVKKRARKTAKTSAKPHNS